MAEKHHWLYADSSGQAINPQTLPHTEFPNRADAEAWLGDDWQEVADAGVATVTLMCGDDVVYGPMSLSP